MGMRNLYKEASRLSYIGAYKIKFPAKLFRQSGKLTSIWNEKSNFTTNTNSYIDIQNLDG